MLEKQEIEKKKKGKRRCEAKICPRKKAAKKIAPVQAYVTAFPSSGLARSSISDEKETDEDKEEVTSTDDDEQFGDLDELLRTFGPRGDVVVEPSRADSPTLGSYLPKRPSSVIMFTGRAVKIKVKVKLKKKK